MKNYNELEKKAIDQILDTDIKLQTNNLYNVFFDIKGIFRDNNISFAYPEKNKTSLLIKKEYYQTKLLDNKEMQKFINSFTKKFCTVINLIAYLKKNEYLTILYNENKNGIVKSEDNSDFIPFASMDSNLQEKIYKYSNGIFVPSDKLLELRKNDYQEEDVIRENERIKKEEEQLKFNKTITFITILLSVAAIIASLINPIISYKIETENQNKTFESKNQSINVDEETIDNGKNFSYNIEK